MNKKFSMLLAAIAVVAFAMPAAASANTPTLFDHAGKVPIGAKFITTSTNAVMTTSIGTLKCAKVTITDEVTHNSAGTVRGVGKGEGTTSTCEIATSPPKAFKVTDITVTEIHTKTAGSGTINMTFKTDIPVTGKPDIECHFTSAGLPFTYKVGVTNDVLTIASGNLLGTPAACEPGLVHADFTLETEDGSPVWIQ